MNDVGLSGTPLRHLIAAATGTLSACDIRGGDRLHEDVGLDSLEMADLLVGIESQFGVVVSAALLATLETVSDLEAVVSGAACTAE